MKSQRGGVTIDWPDELFANLTQAVSRHGADAARPRLVRFELIHQRGRMLVEATLDIASLTGALWGFMQVVRGVPFGGIESVAVEFDGVEFGAGLGVAAKCAALERWLVGTGEVS